MQKLTHWIAAGLVALSGVTGAQAAGVTVVCGDTSLGLRTTTVTPALAGSCFAGLQNLGDGALETLVNTKYGISNADLLDRDTANSNGGGLGITGVGEGVGTWSFDPTLWLTNQRLFLYFHFGDGPDSPSTTSQSDPDTFLVELLRPDSSGSWSHFDGTDDKKQQYGLSNIALLRGGQCTLNCLQEAPPAVPEPQSLALAGLALVGMALSRRRKPLHAAA